MVGTFETRTLRGKKQLKATFNVFFTKLIVEKAFLKTFAAIRALNVRKYYPRELSGKNNLADDRQGRLPGRCCPLASHFELTSNLRCLYAKGPIVGKLTETNRKYITYVAREGPCCGYRTEISVKEMRLSNALAEFVIIYAGQYDCLF